VKLVKKAFALLVALTIVVGALSSGINTVAAAVSGPKTTVLQNDFVKITVDNATGRFGIRTIEGQPIRKNDQNVDLMFRGDDPETSFTTFRIDGTDYIFGNPYKFGVNLFSEITPPKIVNLTNGTKQIETIWSIKGVSIKQILMLYADANDVNNAGNVNIRYEVLNRSGANVQLGSRILLDTMVGGNDGPAFQIGTTYRSPLLVERRLVHDPAAIGIPEEDVPVNKLPPYWVMRDTFNLNDPQATNVMAYGFNNFAEQNINIVDEMIVGHWNSLANTKWDYTPNPNLDFTRDTNDYGTADSAVAFYWEPAPIANGQSQSFETVYGLGELVQPDKVFSIRYMDTVQQLATLPGNEGYVDEGVFRIIAEIENLAAFNMKHELVKVQLELEGGLNFVKLDADGNPMRDDNGKILTEAFRSKELDRIKPLTPEQVANGDDPKYQPGDTFTVDFLVQANGKPWPTTRQYMMTVKSEATEKALEGIADEGIKAQYQSVKSNFIMLPPIGEAVPTYVYSMSPGELYNEDVKYLTVNLSNIEAYNTGTDTKPANFDLYLEEVVTGQRYKVPVQQSVLMQPTDDGFSGDMRITYRNGELVDKNGITVKELEGPELPLGEYRVQIDFRDDIEVDEETSEEDAELKKEIMAKYDIKTTQTFMVTDNEETRIREANLLALYKQSVDLSSQASLGDIKQELADELNSLFPGELFEVGDLLFDKISKFREARAYLGMANKALDPEFDLGEFTSANYLKEVPLYQYKMFESDEDLEEFIGDEDFDRELLVTVRGMVKQVGTGLDQQIIVDTETEPAIINDAVAYKGKDMVFVRGNLDVLGMGSKNSDFKQLPFFQTVFIKGEGTLSVASSGFVFHKGEWTLDFFNGFQKSLGDGYTVDRGEIPKSEDNEEDDSLNGSLRWAVGAFGDRLNPLRQVMLETVYFNRHSLFAPPSFTVDGFGLTFNDFILREGGISFGGKLSMKVIEAEVNNVIFNDKGFVGIEANLGFDLNKDMGLFSSKKKEEDKKKKDDEEEEEGAPKGKITVVHYVQEVEDVNNQYGLEFEADIKNIGVSIEFSLKKVADGRILPDVIAFGADLGQPGILLTGATYLTGIRGAVRELADTIAGGTKDDPFPLTIEAGVSLKFGVSPAFFHGDIDLTVKRTGIKVEGKMDFSMVPEPEDDDLLPMLTHALIEAQWVTPWFVRLEAEVDIGGWDIIIGEAGIFVGQNLEKNRIDFEGFIGSRVQIPSSVPIVGGLPLASMFFGVNNDKIWGSVGILFISLGVTYYWGGGLEFGTSGEDLPEGFAHLLIEDPERGPRLVVIGQGVETLATSWINAEQESHGIVYREIEKGVQMIENGATSIGIGGITSKNGGRVHEIPMGGVTGNAIIEVEYDSKTMPELSLKDGSGKNYPLVFDNTNSKPNANAFTQHIPASKSTDGVDVRKAYIIVPQNKATGTWTLTALSGVETRLMNAPTTPELTETKLTKNPADPNVFTASWKAENAKAGDTVNLYLTKDAVTNETTKLENGDEVLKPGDPGLLIAKELPIAQNGGVSGSITSGSASINVSEVQLLGDVEDIRGLLAQGNYYLRAELRSQMGFSTKTSAERIELIDPLAPAKVTDVVIEPAGNGLFSLSFKPGTRKAGHADFEHSYAIEAFSEVNGKLESYPNFGEVLFTAEELAPYWNQATGKYEGVLLGGWTAVSANDEVNGDSLAGTVIAKEDIKYSGLQVGKEYVLGVSAVTKPTKAADKNENYHFADRIDSTKKLLPVPVKPKLNVPAGSDVTVLPHAMELLTNVTEQRIELTSNQKDIEVEAFYAEQSLGKTAFVNGANGSSGTLTFDQFEADGPYAIELKARNKKTGDISVTMLYLTVDTIAPVLYIDEPVTGARTEVVSGSNKLKVKGTTSTDLQSLKVNGQSIAVADNGAFDGTINVAEGEPTVNLEFVSIDKAGNSNTAVVRVTNAAYQVPSGLVLELPKLKPGESGMIKASLKVADGKDAQGRPTFKEVAIKPQDMSRLSYTISMGDSVSMTEAGKVTGLVTGASLIEAEYRISDDVSITGMVAASVEIPKPTRLGALTASTSEISGNSGKTKLNVTLPQDTTGQQLVYKLFPTGTNAVTPAFEEDLNQWDFVPADGAVPAKAGDTIIVALRTSLDKKAWSASSKLSAKVWAQTGTPPIIPGPGGGPGVIIPEPEEEEEAPAEEIRLTVNGKEVAAEWKGTTAVIRVTEEDVASDMTGDIVIAVQSAASAKGYAFTVDKAVVKQAQDGKKTIKLDLPGTKLDITPEMLKGLEGDLSIQLADNGSAAKRQLDAIAKQIGASALGAGDGVAIDTNLPDSAWNKYVSLKVAVPATVDPKNITAMVLKGADGNWTTVPWKLEKIGGESFVHILLTGEGNVAFIQSGGTFKDVPGTHWGAVGISNAASKLFVLGKAADRFDPNAKVTRAEYPTILLRVAGLMNRTADNGYTDVAEGIWYERSVAVASELGIVNGFEDGSYAPNATLSRLEAMVMVGRLINALGLGAELSEEETNSLLTPFGDGSAIPEWAKAAVALTIKYGIILGEDGNVNPKGVLNRAQAAAIAVRLDQLITKE
jgi:hypothetical protein